ncbi:MULTISPECIES: SPOR domain-containing protein [Marinovum]|uniref:SPOR domain-containing protein n=1 Tax=Marinovum TaxID=367771 RepID=UPI00065B1C22|nr:MULTISPECIES: SPOR domain-containing protein [Marinovum]AKO96701.1 Cell division protein [Marinovum algicola DG 898]MDD9739330.1 SPOR domain-containing protein [Marinovum sp. SP66]MDD9744066.1 SPOR domain-containing protein [Marinovum sp. PR37]
MPRGARVLLAGTAIWLLAACENGAQLPGFLQSKDSAATAAAPASRATRLVERDVEAPDVFQVTEGGLWDGRPSLGGVWVAHPDVREPERVIIRNPSNGKFVIGALFRKERATPGPELQVSSDAADALGLVAGQPTNLNVTALRREKTPETPQVPETLDPAGLDAPEAITASELDAPAASAAAAIAAAPATPPRPKPAPQAASLDKPYIQLGIFSIEKNAENTAAAMKSRGLNAIIKKQSSQGKTFWRVLVGPAASAAERAAALGTIKSAGFTDAYAVTN